MNKQKREKKKKKAIILVFLGILLIGVMFLYFAKKQPPIVSSGLAMGSEKISGTPQIKKKIENAQVRLRISPVVTIKKSSREGKWKIENVLENKYGQQAVLTLKDNNKILGESDFLKPGYQSSTFHFHIRKYGCNIITTTANNRSFS